MHDACLTSPAMMRPVTVAALLAVASAEPMVAGGTLKLTWSDCGGVHGKATSIQPAALTLGTPTNIIGKGAVDEAVSGGGFEISVKAGIIPLVDHKGDLCKADAISLPGGIGSIQWKGLPCPLAAGPIEVDMTVTLSANIPASLASTTIKLTGTGINGDSLLCVQLNTAPEAEEPVVV